MEERKYRVKLAWIENLESMHDKLYCVWYDIQEGKLELPLTLTGKTIHDEDELFELIDECDQLAWIAKTRKVTGREYGRMKQVVEWRVYVRYSHCIEAGMDERTAGQCFADM